MLRRRALGLLSGWLLLTSACVTTEQKPSARSQEATRSVVQTADGSKVALRRWSTGGADAARVLVVPELGFDWRLYAPLCSYLHWRGYDVALVETDELSGEEGWNGWVRQVAAVAVAHGPAPRILAIGVGGAAAWSVAAEGGAATLLAVNVPLRWEVGNVRSVELLADHRFDPHAWMRTGAEQVVLGAGRQTPTRALRTLSSNARPLPERLQWDVASRFTSKALESLPQVPTSLFVSVKDNLVAPEHALAGVESHEGPIRTRRLGMMEYFTRDYGHLDWLADEKAHSDVFPVIAAELEALR